MELRARFNENACGSTEKGTFNSEKLNTIGNVIFSFRTISMQAQQWYLVAVRQEATFL